MSHQSHSDGRQQYRKPRRSRRSGRECPREPNEPPAGGEASGPGSEVSGS